MIVLLLRNLVRRPFRNALTLGGISVAVAALMCIVTFGENYRTTLRSELDRAGVQMMLVPLGCPYDAAARVLKNNTLENSLPEAALLEARNDPAIAIAAPLLMAAQPRANDHRTDLWVGLDENALQLKPWWRARAGRAWFVKTNEVILGADAASVELRAPGDKLFSPETGFQFEVAGVLERGGTSDDSAFFLPLATAQKMFAQTNRLTAIAIRLNDPAELRDASARLQKIPGAQVVTMTEMMGTFLNLLGAMRSLVLAIAAIAMVASALTVFNTLLASVLERTNEFAVMRAVGASRAQVFALLINESLLLCGLGSAFGVVLALLAGPQVEELARRCFSFTAHQTTLAISAQTIVRYSFFTILVGVTAALYPAWRASRIAPALAAKDI